MEIYYDDVDSGLRKIIVDCSELGYISSFGLGVLIRLHSRLARHGGNVKIASVKGVVVEVMRLTKMNKLFEIYPDVSRARLAFRPENTAS